MLLNVRSGEMCLILAKWSEKAKMLEITADRVCAIAMQRANDTMGEAGEHCNTGKYERAWFKSDHLHALTHTHILNSA